MKTYENLCGYICQSGFGIFFSEKLLSCWMLSIYYDSDGSSKLGSEIPGYSTLIGKKQLILFMFNSTEKFCPATFFYSQNVRYQSVLATCINIFFLDHKCKGLFCLFGIILAWHRLPFAPLWVVERCARGRRGKKLLLRELDRAICHASLSWTSF